MNPHKRLAAWLRETADALDPPKRPVPTGISFTAERFTGYTPNKTGLGCPLFCWSSDLPRAYREAIEPDPVSLLPSQSHRRSR